MALNFSRRPIFPRHLSEDNLVAPSRITSGYFVEGIPGNNGDGFGGKPWFSNRGVDGCFDFGRDMCDRGGTHESVTKDILDLLPSDPFGMHISTSFTAITGWIGDLDVDYGGFKGEHSAGANDDNYQLFTGLNFIWNNTMRFQAFPGNLMIDNRSNVSGGFDCCFEKDVGVASCSGGFDTSCNVDDILGYDNEGLETIQSREAYQDYPVSEGDEVAHHPALSFALSYLDLQDLLNVEMVCKSLCSAVQGDSLLWRTIHIDQPLNEKITDDILLKLTNRAQGNLQCLSLVECPRITDDGLKQILESNPKLIKLSVPGCTRLSIEGVVNILRDFKSMGSEGVKHLRIGGLYGVTQKHFEELMFLLGTDSQTLQYKHKPHFYHRGSFYLSCEDDRAIDIEMCPRCQNYRLVYDCPAESCQRKEHGGQLCRACTLCIARCVQCGRCISDGEYEETFCLELLCSGCWKQVKCEERQDMKVSPIKFSVLLDQGSSLYHHG